MQRRRVGTLKTLGAIALITIAITNSDLARAADRGSSTPLTRELLEASHQNDTEAALSAIDKGANVNTKDELGSTPLIWAAVHDNRRLINTLVDKGADMEAVSIAGRTAILEAAIQGSKSAVEILRWRGASTAVKDDIGVSFKAVEYAQPQFGILYRTFRLAYLAVPNPTAGDVRMLKEWLVYGFSGAGPSEAGLNANDEVDPLDKKVAVVIASVFGPSLVGECLKALPERYQDEFFTAVQEAYRKRGFGLPNDRRTLGVSAILKRVAAANRDAQENYPTHRGRKKKEKSTMMLKNGTMKTAALAGVLGIGAAGGAILTTVAEANLFRKEEAHAQTKASVAELEKARAALLDAQNKLTATQGLALAQIEAAKLQAQGYIAAAQHQAAATITASKFNSDGMVKASQVSYHADNEAYDNITGPLFAEPMKRIDNLNQRIVRLQWEIATGIDSRTRRQLSDAEMADRMTQQANAQEEMGIVVASTQKNYKDVAGMVLGSVGQLLGDAIGAGRNSTSTQTASLTGFTLASGR